MLIEIDKRGREPTHYYTVGARAHSASDRRVHVGYIMRARPTDDEWFAAIKYRTGAPVIIQGANPTELVPKIREHILARKAEMP